MSLLDDNFVETAFDETQMRKEYLGNWLIRHSGQESPGIVRYARQAFTGAGLISYHLCHIPFNKSYNFNHDVKLVQELDGRHVSDRPEPITQINTSNIINIKPTPNQKYLITNITDGDLPLFELRTRNKQGGILYCINCTRKIVDKSHKWLYKFLEFDESTNTYNIVEER